MWNGCIQLYTKLITDQSNDQKISSNQLKGLFIILLPQKEIIVIEKIIKKSYIPIIVDKLKLTHKQNKKMFVETFDLFLCIPKKLIYLGHIGKLSFPPKITLALVQRAPTKPPDDEGCPPLSPTKFNSTSTTLTPLHGTDLLHMNWTSSFVIVVPLTFLNSTLLIATFESYKTHKSYIFLSWSREVLVWDFLGYIYLLRLLSRSFGQWWLGSWRLSA